MDDEKSSDAVRFETVEAHFRSHCYCDLDEEIDTLIGSTGNMCHYWRDRPDSEDMITGFVLIHVFSSAHAILSGGVTGINYSLGHEMSNVEDTLVSRRMDAESTDLADIAESALMAFLPYVGDPSIPPYVDELGPSRRSSLGRVLDVLGPDAVREIAQSQLFDFQAASEDFDFDVYGGLLAISRYIFGVYLKSIAWIGVERAADDDYQDDADLDDRFLYVGKRLRETCRCLRQVELEMGTFGQEYFDVELAPCISLASDSLERLIERRQGGRPPDKAFTLLPFVQSTLLPVHISFGAPGRMIEALCAHAQEMGLLPTDFKFLNNQYGRRLDPYWVLRLLECGDEWDGRRVIVGLTMFRELVGWGYFSLPPANGAFGTYCQDARLVALSRNFPLALDAIRGEILRTAGPDFEFYISDDVFSLEVENGDWANPFSLFLYWDWMVCHLRDKRTNVCPLSLPYSSRPLPFRPLAPAGTWNSATVYELDDTEAFRERPALVDLFSETPGEE